MTATNDGPSAGPTSGGVVRAVTAAISMMVLAAMEPATGGFAWGVHYPAPRILHTASAAVGLTGYALVLAMLSFESPALARRLLVGMAIPWFVFGAFAFAWALFFVVQGWVPYLLLLIWSVCVLYAQYLGVTAARQLQS